MWFFRQALGKPSRKAHVKLILEMDRSVFLHISRLFFNVSTALVERNKYRKKKTVENVLLNSLLMLSFIIFKS